MRAVESDRRWRACRFGDRGHAGQVSSFGSVECVGAYLHGSAGLGQLRPQSDIDVLVVLDAPLTTIERERLTDFALRVSGHYPRARDGPRPIELTVIVHNEVRPWRYPPRCEYQYGEWLRGEIESGLIRGPFECPDLAVALGMVLRCRAPLFGPDPSKLFDPVPTADLVRAGTEGIVGLLRDLDRDTTNVVLTLARIWHTRVTGALATKEEAAVWAATRSSGEVAAALIRARAAYLDGEQHAWDHSSSRMRVTGQVLVAAIRDANVTW